MNCQIAIIGGGPAGYTAAEAAAKAGQQVVLFEKNSLGGVCLNEGCIPTKTLLYSAKLYDNAKYAAKYGVEISDASFDLPKILSRKNKVVRKLTLGIKSRLTAAGVTMVNEKAYIEDAHTIRCGEQTYHCDKLILCTGSATFIPPIKGLETVPYWTHRDALECKELPQTLTIIGGGVIGMEFASFFNSLGVQVTVVEMMNEILNGIDREIAALLHAEYEKKGIRFYCGKKVDRVVSTSDGVQLSFHGDDDKQDTVISDKILLSVGRRPVTDGFGLENLCLEQDGRGRITTNAFIQSSVPDVYVCGDLNGKSMLAHTAVREAEIAVSHILGQDLSMSYDAIPGVVYTNPEVASVGQTEESLKAAGLSYHAIKLPMAYSGRFVAENERTNGVIKVLLSDDDTVLGIHMIGNPASELIAFGSIMLSEKYKTEELKKYIFPHPTVGEILREL